MCCGTNAVAAHVLHRQDCGHSAGPPIVPRLVAGQGQAAARQSARGKAHGTAPATPASPTGRGPQGPPRRPCGGIKAPKGRHYAPPDPDFIAGQNVTLQKETLIWAVSGTQTFGLLGSRTPPPPTHTPPELCPRLGGPQVHELRRQRHRLDPNHVAAIFVYTYQLPAGPEGPDTAQIYSAMNTALRTGDHKAIAFWRPLIWSVDVALQALPPHKGKLYRGLDCTLRGDEYVAGGCIGWPAFSSSSQSLAVAKDFSLGDSGTLFFLLSRSARCLPLRSVPSRPL